MDDLLTSDACTLPTAERPLRLAEFDALFAASATRVTRGDRQVSIHLEGDLGLGQRVRDLAAREAACCSFFSFSVDGEGQDVTLTVTVPEERQSILDALADRANRFRTSRQG